MESQTTLRQRIAKAIRKQDKQELLRLKGLLKQQIWLNSFNGSIPPAAWLTSSIINLYSDGKN